MTIPLTGSSTVTTNAHVNGTHANRNVMAYFGHHKCASQYIQAIVRNVCEHLDLSLQIEAMPEKLPNGWHLKEEYRQCYPKAVAAISTCDYNFLCHGNAAIGLLEIFAHKTYRGFHVVRDPRDMLVSGYFSHKNSHNVSKSPWMAEHRDRLQQVDLAAGLSLELDYSSVYFDALSGWDYTNPQIYETNFETLVRQPLQEFARIFLFLGIKVSPVMPQILSLKNIVRKKVCGSASDNRILSEATLHRFVSQHSFEKKSGGRAPGAEDPNHHYRKGTPGDWKAYFFPSLTDQFKERYGQLLIRLGYESNMDW